MSIEGKHELLEWFLKTNISEILRDKEGEMISISLYTYVKTGNFLAEKLKFDKKVIRKWEDDEKKEYSLGKVFKLEVHFEDEYVKGVGGGNYYFQLDFTFLIDDKCEIEEASRNNEKDTDCGFIDLYLALGLKKYHKPKTVSWEEGFQILLNFLTKLNESLS